MAEMTYFALFALPRHLHIDPAALETSFYAQSRRLHPDRFAARPPADQQAALARASELNDAYRTLRDPIARTEYLLALEGIRPEEQSREDAGATGTGKKQAAPPDLLQEAFELNMQLEEMRFAKAAGDRDETVARDLEAAHLRFSSMLDDLQKELEAHWTVWDRAEDANDAAGRTAARDAMAALLQRRSYVRNLVRDVGAALDE